MTFDLRFESFGRLKLASPTNDNTCVVQKAVTTRYGCSYGITLVPVRYSVRSLGQRLTSSAMTALSVALVVMVLTILLGFVDGMRRTLMQAVRIDNCILLYRGVTVEAGFINHQTLDIIRARPEIATNAKREPLISPEILGAFDPTPDAPRASTATIRAIRAIGYEVHNKIKMIEGRRPI